MKRFTLRRHYQDHDDRPGEPFTQIVAGIPETGAAAQLRAEDANHLRRLVIGARLTDADGDQWERTA